MTLEALTLQEAPLTTRFFDEICNEFPLLRGKISSYKSKLFSLGEQYFKDAEYIMSIAENICSEKKVDRKYLLDCFAEFVIDYLREQEYFLRTGIYRNSNRDFEDIVQEVYKDDKYMSEYMMGLLISYAIFPHHYSQYHFYTKNFLNRLNPYGKTVEFGSGHGLFLAETLRHIPNSHVTGYDVSPAAIEMTDILFHVTNTPRKNCNVILGDILKEDLPETQYSGMTAAGLLEHLPDPAGFLDRIRLKLQSKDGYIFVMLPINTAHSDHMILFENAEECRELMYNSGFELVDESIVPTEDFGEEELREKRIPIIYLGIYKPHV